MGAPCSITCVLCSDLPLYLSLESEYHSSHVLKFPFICVSRMWVPLASLNSFYVLTYLQDVSAPCLLTFSLNPNLSICLCSLESECPSLRFLQCSDLSVPLHSLESECPHLLGFFPFHNLTNYLHSSVCECPHLLGSFHSNCPLVCAL